MTGRVFFDGVDIWTEYKAFVTQDGYKSIVQWPSLKKPDSNDWAEEAGIEADLSNPVLDSRSVSLDMSFTTEIGYIAFRETLLETTWHDFTFMEIRRVVRMRLVSESGLKMMQGLCCCTFKFSDDTPLRDYTYQSPVSAQAESDGYLIDGKDLKAYGVRVLQGTLPELVSMPQVKEALTIESKYMAGAQYDGGGTVQLKDKTMTLTLLMRAETLVSLWRNYDALLYDIVRPGEHTLSVESAGCEHVFYYESCSVEKFHATGKIWLEFKLKLHVTQFGGNNMGYSLVTVDGREITTEDGRSIVMEENFKN